MFRAQSGRRSQRLVAAAWICAGVMGGVTAQAADFTPRELAEQLFKASAGERIEITDRNLSLIDLSRLNFKQAILTGSDLYGTDLTEATLAGADLSETRLDRATIIRTDFSKADLTDATLLRPTTFSDAKFDTDDAARFTDARLVRLRALARLDGADFRGADLTDADFAPLDLRSGTIAQDPSSHLPSANFSDAVLRGVNFARVDLSFAKFNNADATGASFRNADLTAADFSGANIAGADFAGANLADVNFEGVRGLNAAKGVVALRTTTKEIP